MANSTDTHEIAAQEWLNHIRSISRRINGIIGHVVPGHRNPMRAKREGWTYKKDQHTAWATCRIVHESVGWCHMVVSFWGSHSVEVYVRIAFGRNTVRDHVHWGVKHSYGNLDHVAQKFSNAADYSRQVERIVDLMLPLAPLFSNDKFGWVIGEERLQALEQAAGKPARRKGRAKV